MNKKYPYKRPAFPNNKNTNDFNSGLTIRDYFASKAMQSIIIRLGGTPLVREDEQDTFILLSKESYKYADAMLDQREI